MQIFLLCIILLLQLIFLWVSIDKEMPIELNSILTILGWLAVYYFGFRQLKNKISLDRKIIIYDRLTKLKQSLDEAFVFNLMTYVSHFKVFEISILANPSKELLDYSEDLGKKSFNSHKTFQNLDNCIRAWIFLMPKLESAGIIVAKEFYDFLEKTDSLKEAVSDYALNFNSSEKSQKRGVIEEIIKDIEDNSSNIVNFVDDLMEMISDELTFPVFHYRVRRGIKNLREGQLYKKLTRDGIKEVPYVLKDFQGN